jgi:DNA-binding HxlR family transcriptional regulator
MESSAVSPTGLPQPTLADLARVTETLGLISPRWSVWTLTTLAPAPLRYTDIKSRMPWLADGQLHPRLRKLTASGLIHRTPNGRRHVTYSLTDRATALLPVLTSLTTWGADHLNKPLVTVPGSGTREAKRIPLPEQAEDTLALITPRHHPAILWTLKARGTTSARSLGAIVVPTRHITCIYPPLHRLIDDGIAEAVNDGLAYRLTPHGHSLGPVFAGLSAWAAGRPLTDARHHPLWGHASTSLTRRPNGSWLTSQQRPPAPATRTPHEGTPTR